MNERQERILQLLAEGRRDKQIAHELQISDTWVRVSIKRVVEELGAKTRCHAVALYLKSQNWDD